MKTLEGLDTIIETQTQARQGLIERCILQRHRLHAMFQISVVRPLGQRNTFIDDSWTTRNVFQHTASDQQASATISSRFDVDTDSIGQPN